MTLICNCSHLSNWTCSTKKAFQNPKLRQSRPATSPSPSSPRRSPCRLATPAFPVGHSLCSVGAPAGSRCPLHAAVPADPGSPSPFSVPVDSGSPCPFNIPVVSGSLCPVSVPAGPSSKTDLLTTDPQSLPAPHVPLPVVPSPAPPFPPLVPHVPVPSVPQPCRPVLAPPLLLPLSVVGCYCGDRRTLG